MSLTLASSRVPAEFLGQARALRTAIAAEDQAVGEMVTQLDGTIRDRVQRGNPIPRRDVLAGVARDWQRRLPQRGRLALEIDLAKRGKSLSVREMRLSSSEYLDSTWRETERGLALLVIGLDCAPLRYEFVKHTLCHVSLHALARRLERGADVTEGAILQDMRALGEAHRALADRPNGAAFTVPVMGGSWRGNVALMRTPRGSFDKGLVIRTFIADGT